MMAHMDSGLEITSINYKLDIEINRCLEEVDIPKWMTKGKTILILKDPNKITGPNNYKPITFLLMMGKILKAHIKGKIYY